MNQIIRGMAEAEYHATKALSYSGLKELKKGPGYFKYWQDHPEENEDTDARLLGRLVGMKLSEPERFEASVVCIEGHRGTKSVKEVVALAESNGKVVCKPEMFQEVCDAVDYMKEHTEVKKLLEEGHGEVTLMWDCPEFKVQKKCRVDWLTKNWVMVDWKTFDDLSDDAIERQIRKQRYQWQASHYSEGGLVLSGVKPVFANVFIRTKKPVDCRVICLTEQSIQDAAIHYNPLVDMYAKCLEADHWPMSQQTVTEIATKPFFD